MKQQKQDTKFKIESGFPVPQGPRGRSSKYPFGDMKVGDSFLVEQLVGIQIASACCYYGKRHGTKFSIRTIRDGNGALIGSRVWRIE